MEPTIVHVCRHGQVENPDHVLYGRTPGYGLSDLGRRMAERLADWFDGVELQALRCSPLQRAQETMAPIAAKHPELELVTDARLIEAANKLEGKSFGRFNERLLLPQNMMHLWNPFRPSWGEPYTAIIDRMVPAIRDAAASVPQGGQVAVVSHQLPIWLVRLWGEGRPLVHLPNRRQCRLASVTAFHFLEGRLVEVRYSEPCADLYPPGKRLLRPGM